MIAMEPTRAKCARPSITQEPDTIAWSTCTRAGQTTTLTKYASQRYHASSTQLRQSMTCVSAHVVRRRMQGHHGKAERKPFEFRLRWASGSDQHMRIQPKWGGIWRNL